MNITEKQAEELYGAAFDVCACFAADACRVIAEFGDEANLAEYLESLPNKYAKRLDRIVMQIQEGDMEIETQEVNQRAKYERAMAEMRESQ